MTNQEKKLTEALAYQSRIVDEILAAETAFHGLVAKLHASQNELNWARTQAVKERFASMSDEELVAVRAYELGATKDEWVHEVAKRFAKTLTRETE